MFQVSVIIRTVCTITQVWKQAFQLVSRASFLEFLLSLLNIVSNTIFTKLESDFITPLIEIFQWLSRALWLLPNSIAWCTRYFMNWHLPTSFGSYSIRVHPHLLLWSYQMIWLCLQGFHRCFSLYFKPYSFPPSTHLIFILQTKSWKGTFLTF